MRFLVIIFIFIFGLNASNVKWSGNFNTAYKQAIKENKKLMVLLCKQDNHICKKMLKTTFCNQIYIDEINKNYISVIVMKGQKESYPIEMLYTLLYPVLFILDNKELFICEPLTGKITPDRLQNHLKQCK